jgi:hypothetical protein
MGMELRTVFGPAGCPRWPDVATRLAEAGFPPTVRMIDGELALPDETPPDSWRELRVSTGPGMITIRRDDTGVTVIIWANADEAMHKAWEAVARAFV